MLALDDIEVYGAYSLTLHSDRPTQLLYAADPVNHTVHVFGPVLDKVQVGRISYFRVSTGGIHFDHLKTSGYPSKKSPTSEAKVSG